MSILNRDPKGDRRTRARVEKQQPQQPQSNNDLDPLTTSLIEQSLATGRALESLLDQTGGYLKVRREVEGPDVHLTWTWSCGVLAGTYVYVRVEHWRIAYGIDVLRGKIYQSEAGTRRPSPDKRYPPK